MGNNKICTTIGTSDINKLGIMFDDSLNSSANYFEIRFDFLDNSTLNDALAIVLDYKDQAVFTCRTQNEGGKYRGAEQDRLKILGRLATFRPMLLDIEYQTMKENEYLLDQITALNCDILVSWHDFEETPTKDHLISMSEKMKKYSNNIKIVCMAKSLEDSISVLKLYENASISNINLIAFCMGEHGILSRVLCTYAGSRFTYASLGEALTPGQLTIKQIRTIFERLDHEKSELNNYGKWKNRQDFNDILNVINDSVR